MRIKIEVEGASQEEIDKYTEIFAALITTGGLSGMRNGSTNIHFDNQGGFQGIRFDYWPYRKRDSNKS